MYCYCLISRVPFHSDWWSDHRGLIFPFSVPFFYPYPSPSPLEKNKINALWKMVYYVYPCLPWQLCRCVLGWWSVQIFVLHRREVGEYRDYSVSWKDELARDAAVNHTSTSVTLSSSLFYVSSLFFQDPQTCRTRCRVFSMWGISYPCMPRGRSMDLSALWGETDKNDLAGEGFRDCCIPQRKCCNCRWMHMFLTHTILLDGITVLLGLILKWLRRGNYLYSSDTLYSPVFLWLQLQSITDVLFYV